MAGYSVFEIQKAIDVILTADAPLLALLGTGDSDSIYDNPGQVDFKKVKFPIVVYTGNSAVPFDTKTDNGTEALIDITAWSRSGDKEEVSNITSQIHTLLHNANLTVANNHFILCQWDGAATIDVDDNDELVTYQGIIRFRVLTDEV